MNQFEITPNPRQSECKALLDACTPLVYIHNAFRITGLAVDASTRDIKRRIDDLKAAEEMGDAEEEHSHAFALHPPPGLELIREAALRLRDPERRIIEELFWFWPMEWGRGKQDPALVALANGDKESPLDTWTQAVSEGYAKSSIVSKHNLGVFYQLVALDWEELALEQDLSADSMIRIDKYWRRCFEWWEELTEDETFWSLVAERIRSFDDPRLTTGFARRMRATLPEAMDKINALLAMQFIENGKPELARKHIVYMKETHQGLDDVPKTLAMITEPLQTRIRHAVEKATEIAERQPERAAQAAHDLFETVSGPLEIIRSILPPEDHHRIDLCDAVAEAGLACQDSLAREQRDWKQCLAILTEAQCFAESEETRERIAEHSALAQGVSLLDPIFLVCEQVFSAAEDKPENAMSEGQRLLSSVKPMLARLHESNAPDELKIRARNEVAGTLMQCAVLFGNETEKWEPCINLLDASLRIAASADLKEDIAKNLHTVQQNANVFGNLKPISSAPSLSTTNGIGFTLYGATDHDPQTGSYLSTYYFVFFAIPVFPIRRYRVIPTAGGYRFLGKAPLRTFDKWHLFISLALIALFVFYMLAESNSGTTYPSSPSSSPRSRSVSSPPRSSYGSPSSGSTLANEIESGKRRAEVMEAQIEEMDKRLEDYERKMNSYRVTGMADEYNRLVPTFNALVKQRNQIYLDYSALINDVNDKVKRYNARNR